MVERETACTVDCCYCMEVGGAAFSLLRTWAPRVAQHQYTAYYFTLYHCTFYRQHGIIHILLSRSLSLFLYTSNLSWSATKKTTSREEERKNPSPRALDPAATTRIRRLPPDRRLRLPAGIWAIATRNDAPGRD